MGGLIPLSLKMLQAMALKFVAVTLLQFGGSSFYYPTGVFIGAAAAEGVVPRVGPTFFGAVYFRGVGGWESVVGGVGRTAPRATRTSALVLLAGRFVRRAGGVSKATSALSVILRHTVSGLTQVSLLPN